MKLYETHLVNKPFSKFPKTNKNPANMLLIWPIYCNTFFNFYEFSTEVTIFNSIAKKWSKLQQQKLVRCRYILHLGISAGSFPIPIIQWLEIQPLMRAAAFGPKMTLGVGQRTRGLRELDKRWNCHSYVQLSLLNNELQKL